MSAARAGPLGRLAFAILDGAAATWLVAALPAAAQEPDVEQAAHRELGAFFARWVYSASAGGQ